jgi:3D (Asp-Asp-Asp) domain-containing protein
MDNLMRNKIKKVMKAERKIMREENRRRTNFYGKLTAILLFIILIGFSFATYYQNKLYSDLIYRAKEILSMSPENRLEANFEPLGASVEPTLARITCYKATGNRMANGQYPSEGFVATSDRTIPLGTKIVIDGIEYEVGDRTALWVHEQKGFTIDIYKDDCDLSFGANKKPIIIK